MKLVYDKHGINRYVRDDEADGWKPCPHCDGRGYTTRMLWQRPWPTTYGIQAIWQEPICERCGGDGQEKDGTVYYRRFYS